MSADTAVSDELWPDEDDEPEAEARARRDEQPMSPLVVVLYVVFFYLVWQILTRSDESEILSHLPATSPLRGPGSHVEHSQQQYQFPYPLAAHIPSPIRDAEHAGSAPSAWRTALAAVLYPFYLLLTLAVIPLPFLHQALTLVVSVVATVLYPLTSTTRLLSRTFIVGPLSLLQALFQALYPVYVFVGGVLGLGCFLGMSAGWLGQFSLDLLLRRGPKARKASRRRAKKHTHHAHSPKSHTRTYAHSPSPPSSPVAAQKAPERERERYRVPARSPEIRTFHGRYVPVADIWDDPALSAVSAVAGEPVIVGVRRRGMRKDA